MAVKIVNGHNFAELTEALESPLKPANRLA